MSSGRKPELLAHVDAVCDLLLVQVNTAHDGYQVEPMVLQCWMIGTLHELFLKSGGEGHELMDEVCHLHELEIVFESGVAFAYILELFPVLTL